MIKKSSMLFAAAIFSYGAPYVYAEIQIHPNMSADEVKALIAETADALDLPDSGSVVAPPEDQYDTPHPIPGYVTLNTNPPVKRITGPCEAPPNPSYSLTGYDMGDQEAIGTFFVTADTNRLTGDSAPWVSITKDDFPEGAGIAAGDGWALIERADTFGSRWELYTQADVVVYSIEINIWDRYKDLVVNGNGRVTGRTLVPIGKHGVFDVFGLGPTKIAGEITDGSANGYPFTKNSSAWPLDTHVTYSVPVLGTPSDLFGTMTITFPSGFKGSSSIIGGFLGYIADTDCMPAHSVEINSYENNLLNFTVVGEGAVAIVEKDSQKVVQGPFIVERDEGQKDFTTQFVPTPGTCYVMTDRDSEKVMTDKYCF